MTEINKKLLQEVLSLPSNLRTKLIDKLIKSLNVPIQKEIDELWANEVERRITEIESGKIETISGDIVFDKIRKRFKK
ncbi:MAG: hypothetical protein GF353_09605 [Candidatus Lokiarchaeota archaeon]|nr:hypothetical protein [Candidatus Lokiarchaeota archaeon]